MPTGGGGPARTRPDATVDIDLPTPFAVSDGNCPKQLLNQGRGGAGEATRHRDIGAR